MKLQSGDGSKLFVSILTSNGGTTWHLDPDEAKAVYDDLEELALQEPSRFVRLESRWVDKAEFDRVAETAHENEFGHLVVELTEEATT